MRIRAPFFFAVMALVPAIASADKNLPATMETAGPIAIDDCKTWLSDYSATSIANLNYWMNAQVTFTNVSSRPVVAVRFGFNVLDDFGDVVRTFSGDSTGTFAPGVAIQPGFRSGTVGQTNTWSVINISPNAVGGQCQVLMARFADGTIWRRGQPYSILTYPTFPPSPRP